MARVSKKTLFLISFGVLIVASSFVFAERVDAVAVGNNIKFTANTNIRSCAGTTNNCRITETAPSGSTATVIGGPKSANNYTWWNIKLTSGVTGWSFQNNMSVVASQPPAPKCPNGNGLYCGSSSISGQNTNYLYSCSNGSYSLSQSCPNGCEKNAASANDSCKSAPVPIPTVSVSVNPTSIILNQSFTLTWSSTNVTSCTGYRGGSYDKSGTLTITPSSLGIYTTGMSCTGSGGTSPMTTKNVTVSAAPVASCPNGNGLYCGSSSISGQNVNYLYNCSNGSYSLSQSCPNGCEKNAARANDSCKQTVAPTPTPTPTPGACPVSGSPSANKKAGESFTVNWCVKDVTNCSVTGPGPNSGPYALPNNKCSGSFTLSKQSSDTPYVYKITGTGSDGKEIEAFAEVVVDSDGGGGPSGGPPGGPPGEPPGGTPGGPPGASQTLVVALTATPPSVITGQTVTLKADVSGTAQGNINYTFYCNRPDSDVNITSPNNGKFDNISSTTKSIDCKYSSSDSYTAKVIVERGSAKPAQAIAKIKVLISGGTPTLPPECNDTNDNDGDGLVDLQDPGCSSTADEDEIDPVPVPGGGSPPGGGAGPGANEPIINTFSAEGTFEVKFEAISGSSLACSIDASPKTLILPKNTSTLTWLCNRAVNGCSISDDNPKLDDIGAVDSTGSRPTQPIDRTTKFTLQCPGISDILPVTIRLFTPFLKEIIPQ